MAEKLVFTEESLQTLVDETKTLVDEEVATRATTGHGIYYGTCSTASGTAAKVVTLADATGFSLKTGAIIAVKFTNANSVASPTLNVNSTGAKSIMRYGTTAVSTSSTVNGWTAGAVQVFVYDGTNWVADYWYNSTYSNASMGQGYATCTTAEATAAKAATLSSYSLQTGGIVSVKFTYAVPANATLNVNAKGAKAIYYRGAAIPADIIKAGDTATFIYDGTQYHLIAIDNMSDIQEQFDNARNRVWVATCDNMATTKASCSTTTGDFQLVEGATIYVHFIYSAMANSSLNVDGQGDVYLYTRSSSTYQQLSEMLSGMVCLVYTDGKFVVVNALTSSTTSSNRVIGASASAVKSAYDLANTANTLANAANTLANTANNNFVNYYTSEQVDTALATKADSGHNHDDVYYTETEIDTLLNEKSNTGHTHSTYAAKSNPICSGSLSLNRKANTTKGNYSAAIGLMTIASGTSSIAEGDQTTASGDFSHAEGQSTTASGISSHAEGNCTIASGYASHAEGVITFATTDTTATGTAEDLSTSDAGYAAHAEGYKTVANGQASHAEGNGTTASGLHSHAEGFTSVASGNQSHAEGASTASGLTSHAEGALTTASGTVSHAEGNQTTASGEGSHAEGIGTIASGLYSHAEGYCTESLDYQHAQGHYNNTATATAGVSSGSANVTGFVIGCGTESSAKNAFRVTYSGKVFATSSAITSGADYAEFFEWQDSNPNNEDRRGYFVTLDGNKIKIAEPDDYILGIVSGRPAMIGNGDEEWMGRYILDEFGDFITEEFEYKENIVDKETGETKTVTKIGTKYKENPDYDPTRPYIQREDRPEWDAVGMIGMLSVRDDGTCDVNGFCKVAEGGIATASESGYRVIKRINENIVKVVFK